jgi:hypothetical protein
MRENHRTCLEARTTPVIPSHEEMYEGSLTRTGCGFLFPFQIRKQILKNYPQDVHGDTTISSGTKETVSP